MRQKFLMKPVIFIFVLLFTATVVSAQTVNPARLKINGVVGLNSSYADVVKAFGKPVTETKPRSEQCTGGFEKTVEYTGLSFYFMDGPSRGGKTFMVMTFAVTSPKYTVSGVKLGDSQAVVRRKFGRTYTVDTDRAKGETTWIYRISDKDGPGQSSVTFRNGKVVEIGSAFTVC